ncbi:MAG: hypothetical protein IPH13_21375 [Planctomycetes bacterium]|nr:hypothetical protein [Planctomycetota bacterium]MCC7170885.1 hypothetical protein [Planctomycetota bacterium]
MVLLFAVLWPFSDTLVGDGCMLSFDTRKTGFAPFQVERPADVDARPANLVTSDINGWIVPETELMVRELRARRLPLWNPYVLCGQPLLANLAFAPFYPPNLLALAIDPLRALAWITVLHYWLAGVFVYFWLRRFGLGLGAGLVGALACALTTWMTTRFHLPTIAMTAAWFPGMVLAFERLLLKPGTNAVTRLAVCVGGAALAGFPQLLALELLGLAVYGFVRVVQVRNARVRVGLGAPLAVGVGVLLGAVHLFPAAALFSDSLRSDFASAVAGRALRGAALVGVVHPYAFGDPVTVLSTVARFEDYLPHRVFLGSDVQENAVENAVWFGALPLALVAAAVFALRRRSAALALALVALVGALLSFGVPIPWIEVGSPKRALVLLVIPLAMLTGVGFDALTRRGARSAAGIAAFAIGITVFVVAALCAFAPAIVAAALARCAGSVEITDADRVAFITHLRATSGWVVAVAASALIALVLSVRRAALAVVACAVVVVADLGTFARHFNPAQQREGQYPATPAVKFVRDSGERTVRAHDLTPLPASIGPLLGYRSADGAEPMVMRRIAQFYEALEPGRFDPRDPRVMRPFTDVRVFGHPLFLRTATPFVVANRELPLQRADVVYANDAEGLGVYRLRDSMPRVRLVAGWSFVPEAERLAALRDPTIDPRRLVQIEPHESFGIGNGPGPLDAPAGSVRIVDETASALTVELDGVDRRVWLVLADTFDSGWRVDEELRDGSMRRGSLDIADHAFRAVAVGPETRRVTFRYEPSSFWWGVRASAFALAILVLGEGFGALARRRTRRAAA